MNEIKEQPTLKVIVNGKYALKQGDLFESYDALRQRMDDHSKESFVYYWLRDSRTVEGAFKKASRPIQKRLKYYSVKYACIFGGQRFCPRGSGRRNLQTIRNNCPAYVLVRASKCGNYLEVISLCNEHNHEVSADISKSLSQNRKPSPEIRDEIQQMLLLKIDRNTIIEYVRLKYKKTLIKKDLFNLGARTKRLYANYPVDENLARIMKEHMDDYIRDHKSELSDQDETVSSPDLIQTENQVKADMAELIDMEDYEMKYEYTFNRDAGDDLIEYLSDDDDIDDNHEEDENDVASSLEDYCDAAYETTEKKSEPCSPINDDETIVLEVYNPIEITQTTDYTSGELADTQALLAVLDDNNEFEIDDNIEENQTVTSEGIIFDEVEIFTDIQRSEELTDVNSEINSHHECDKCGQDLTLIQKRVRCMEKYYQKLEEETRILQLRLNNLKCEIELKKKEII